MRIVIDLQSVQLEAQADGISDFALSIVRELAFNSCDHEIIIILSGLFPDTIHKIRSHFKGIFSKEAILVWYVPKFEGLHNLHEEVHRKKAELIREAFLERLEADVVLILGRYDNYTDNIVIFTDIFQKKYSIVVLLYHLNDGLNKDPSLLLTDLRKKYFSKIAFLRIADCIFTNSEKLKESLVREIGSSIFSITSLPDKLSTACKNIISSLGQLVKPPQAYLSPPITQQPKHKLKLAYISPLPPQPSGAANSAAELLSQLEQFYNIDVILVQDDISQSISDQFVIKTISYFKKYYYRYDRVVYHIGNNIIHLTTYELLLEFPGVVVLYDFFLSHFVTNFKNFYPCNFIQTLYHSHGYGAMLELKNVRNFDNVKCKFPCNLNVLQQSVGTIVHSNYALELVKEWYPISKKNKFDMIPLIRSRAEKVNKRFARKRLGIPKESFLICSFGFASPLKLSHELIDAFLTSKLSSKNDVYLIFVGQPTDPNYKAKLVSLAARSKYGAQIKITGWVDNGIYRQYLSAADVAVQLRTQTRGETSGTVLDCMNYGLATIVNSHGPMAELPIDSVYMINDQLTQEELVNALETLYRQPNLRIDLGIRSQNYIHFQHNPSRSAKICFDKIENMYAKFSEFSKIMREFSKQTNSKSNEKLVEIAECLAKNLPAEPRNKQLFVDVSALAREDLRTGIQRIVRAQLLGLIKSPPQGFRVEPVYLSWDGSWKYRYARNYMRHLLDLELTEDDPVDAYEGDLFFIADLHHDMLLQAHQAGLYKELKARGLAISTQVFDLLPTTYPQYFPPGADKNHSAWLATITECSDSIICISQAVADEMKKWVLEHKPNLIESIHITANYPGADISSSDPSKGLPSDYLKVLNKLMSRPSFLMVGTIEPRKGYLQAIQAFEWLWAEGVDINFVIVGKEGWKRYGDGQRRNIPEITKKLQNHPERNRRMFWLESISDEYLEKVYLTCSCLLYTSENEGFGLPLIEASQRKLPIIVRDLPLFREIADKCAYFFKNSLEPEVIAHAVVKWLALFKLDEHPKSDKLPWVTWKESVTKLKEILCPTY